MKKVIFFTLSIVFSLNVIANEVIKITWAGGGGLPKTFAITATAGFTIDWGDGTVETKTGGWQLLSHHYDSFDSFQAIITGGSADCFFTSLTCNGNRITALDLSGCPALQVLNCGANQLSSLDVSKCLKLNRLECYTNQLSSLDLSANITLTQLSCYENRLISLDISKCTALTGLDCFDNQLIDLDLSANIALTGLGCGGNQLSSLDLSANIALERLLCYNNRLTSLDLSNNPALRDRVDCYNNRLSLSDLYAISKKISNPFDRRLGTQTLVPQAVDPGSSVDFSDQAAFEGVATVFEVQKDGSPATISDDYTISAGIITFNEVGNYTVTMTNSAIVANDYYPAKVIAQFWVGIESIKDVAQTPEVLIYPNPTTGKVYIKTENEPAPEVKLYSTDGKLLQHVRNTEIEMSGYDAGVYYLQVDEKMMKIIKK